ncbi:MarR family transcriptional regulator [Kitasatospora sp. MAP5-34]|uniref:MarR family winged helix-turn-helix transcriptional regulator n=1 Tax=Kitasatospora sp. MAP5-34 TaxID=3035102 RepID=UPI0024748AF7|nr:MarR family transcriptional regulator [Kitasatospora sp. MAP5-34]MDH6576140.1 DNA-binding MarR family transcriptional regulator [Kitasatospora sp. MAP5-34]
MAEQEITNGAQAAAAARVRAVGVLLNASALLERLLATAIQRAAGISHSMFEVLLVLAERPDGAPMSELSDRLILTSGGATRLVDRMVAAGLAERRPSPADRRVQLVTMTAEGERTLVTAARAHTEQTDRLLAAAGPTADLTALVPALDHLGRQARALLPPLG